MEATDSSENTGVAYEMDALIGLNKADRTSGACNFITAWKSGVSDYDLAGGDRVGSPFSVHGGREHRRNDVSVVWSF